jgi:predicted GNAT superfamily acetyltransferase
MPTYQIRKAEAKDLDAVLKLNSQFIPKVSEVDKAWLEKYLVQADAFDVCVEGNAILGFLIAMRPDCDYDSVNFHWFKKRYDDFIYVDRIAVATSAQGRGVGLALYVHVEKNFRGKTPIITCEVNIQPPNPQSYGFHQKIGFREVGQQDTKGGTIRVAMLLKDLN